MKFHINKFLMSVMAGTTLLFTACSEGDKVIDDIFDSETRGAVLRTVNLISNELPIGVEGGGFSAELEVQDYENGTLVDFVEVYVGFRDNTPDAGDAGSVTESLYETIDSSTFTIGEFGYPRFSYEVSLSELLSYTGIAEADLFGGDQFTIRFELVLTDGRRYSFADNTGTLTGSFYSSPFLYTPTVVCPVDADKFVGTYTLTSITPGVFGIPTFVEGVVEISIGETSTQRVFEAVYYTDIGQGPREFSFDFVCGDVIPGSEQPTGLSCSGVNLLIGPPPADVAFGTYDPSDDGEFVIVMTDNVISACGGGPVTSSMRLTKVSDD